MLFIRNYTPTDLFVYIICLTLYECPIEIVNIPVNIKTLQKPTKS